MPFWWIVRVFLLHRYDGWLCDKEGIYGTLPGERQVIAKEVVELFTGGLVTGAKDSRRVDRSDDMVGIRRGEKLAVIAHEAEGAAKE